MTARHRLSRSAIAALPTGSSAELLLAAQLEQAGIPPWTQRYTGWEREAEFIDGRKFRADFLWVVQRLIVEVEGGVYIAGRHTRGEGFESGCEKQALAVLAGYKYLRVTPRQVNDGRALAWIRAALGLGDNPIDGSGKVGA